MLQQLSSTTTRLPALFAALVFAIAPGGAWGNCACADCACLASSPDQSCCCARITVQPCCAKHEASQPSRGACCEVGLATSPAGCSCEAASPAEQAALATHEQIRVSFSAAAPLALAFEHLAANLSRGLLADRPFVDVVPKRVLFCVWRN